MATPCHTPMGVGEGCMGEVLGEGERILLNSYLASMVDMDEESLRMSAILLATQ
jgi:hypothetical protein